VPWGRDGGHDWASSSWSSLCHKTYPVRTHKVGAVHEPPLRKTHIGLGH
jgi:hypothetical protein